MSDFPEHNAVLRDGSCHAHEVHYGYPQKTARVPIEKLATIASNYPHIERVEGSLTTISRSSSYVTITNVGTPPTPEEAPILAE